MTTAPLERPLPLYFIVGLAILGPWTLELVRGLPGRVVAEVSRRFVERA